MHFILSMLSFFYGIPRLFFEDKKEHSFECKLHPVLFNFSKITSGLIDLNFENDPDKFALEVETKEGKSSTIQICKYCARHIDFIKDLISELNRPRVNYSNPIDFKVKDLRIPSIMNSDNTRSLIVMDAKFRSEPALYLVVVLDLNIYCYELESAPNNTNGNLFILTGNYISLIEILKVYSKGDIQLLMKNVNCVDLAFQYSQKSHILYDSNRIEKEESLTESPDSE